MHPVMIKNEFVYIQSILIAFYLILLLTRIKLFVGLNAR